MQRPLRVLFVSHLGDLEGGADSILLRLLLNLDRSRIEPLVLMPLRESQTLEAALQQTDIEYLRWHYNSWISFHRYSLRRVYRFFSNLMAVLFLYFKLRRRVEVIYTNTLYSPLGVLLASVLRVPHLWHIHEFIEEDMGATFDLGRRPSMWLVDKASRKILCNSQAIYQKMMQRLPAEKLQVVYPGIFEERPDVLPRTQPLHNGVVSHVSIVGRLSPAKGQEEAIRAVHYLLQHGFEVHLHIAGGGTPAYTKTLENLVEDLKMIPHVTWHGFTDPFSIYEQVDVNLVCSRSEAFGMVVIEPMSIGCPVIGAQAGAIPELIGNSERGLTYIPGDSEMLAQQIQRLLTDAELYSRLSASACEFVYQNFLTKNYVDTIEAVLLELNAS